MVGELSGPSSGHTHATPCTAHSFFSHDNPRREGSESDAENSDGIFRCEGWQGYPGEFEEDVLCILRQNPENCSPWAKIRLKAGRGLGASVRVSGKGRS